MLKQYDTIIIGAGIAGASVAHALRAKGQSVLVLDKKGIASGGSGAAGAFVSPKVGKGSPLQTLTNHAFAFAKDFYLQHTPEHFHQTGVVRIPKDADDAQKFSEYRQFNENRFEVIAKKENMQIPFEGFYFPEAGVCDAKEVCQKLLSGIEVVACEVKQIEKHEGLWIVEEWSASDLVLATGFQSDLYDLRYMGIRGTWGTRGDFTSSLPLSVSMHQSLSVGANIDGVIKLGATHEKGVKEMIPCDASQALALQEKASALVDTTDFALKEVFCGMRAGSKDYFPLVGKVIDVLRMLKEHPALVRGAKAQLQYIDGLYICNGLGGRGFVFAPMMGEMLAECITQSKEVDERVNPDRLFYKWCRKEVGSRN
jgi:tRNA 5-methylaminomethyl-2-thiouridine biosynthesis bifunctional protein